MVLSSTIKYRRHLRANDGGEGVSFLRLRLLRTGEIISGTKLPGTEVKLDRVPAEDPRPPHGL